MTNNEYLNLKMKFIFLLLYISIDFGISSRLQYEKGITYTSVVCSENAIFIIDEIDHSLPNNFCGTILYTLMNFG